MFIYHQKYINLINLYRLLLIKYFLIKVLHFQKMIKKNKKVIYIHYLEGQKILQMHYTKMILNKVKLKIKLYFQHLLIIKQFHIFQPLNQNQHIKHQQLFHLHHHILYLVYINYMYQENKNVDFNIIHLQIHFINTFLQNFLLIYYLHHHAYHLTLLQLYHILLFFLFQYQFQI